jgi:hypothetical protein
VGKPIVYRVGWFSIDDHGERLLIHEREFSREEFERLVNSILIELFEQALNGDKPLLMDDAMYRVAEILVERHGFSTPEFRCVDYEWPLEKSIEWAVDPRLRKAIPPELLERVLEHNERTLRLKLQGTGGAQDSEGGGSNAKKGNEG